MPRPASRVLLCLAFLAVGASYHALRATFGDVERADPPFGTEIGHVARSLQLGDGFSYRIRGDDPVPSVALARDRGPFERVAIRDAAHPLRDDGVPTSWTSPAYVLLLAGVLSAFDGPSPGAAVAALVLNYLFQAAALLLVSGLAFRLLGRAGGIAATALYLMDPDSLVYADVVGPQPLYHLGVAGLLGLGFVPPRRGADAAFGAVAALLLLTDAGSVPIVAAVFAARLLLGRCRGLRPQLRAAAVLLVLVAPWLIRNALVLESPPLVNSVGLALHMGNAPESTETHYYDGHHGAPFWNAPEMLRYASLGERLYARVAGAEAWDFITADLARFGRACLDRATIFWLGTRGLEWRHADLAAEGYRPLPPARPEERLLRLWRALLLVLSPVGLALGLRDAATRPAFLLFGAVLVVFPLIYYVGISGDRYRTPLDPILCLVAGRALAPVAGVALERIRGETRRRLLLAGGAVAASLVVAEIVLRLAVPAYQERFRLFAVRESERGKFTRYDERLGWVGVPYAEDDFTWTDVRFRVRQNAHGFRGREHSVAREDDQAQRRVVVLGDSFVWGFGVGEEALFTTRLERAPPGLELVNLGVSGYGNDQMLLLWRQVGRRFTPDEVWVFVTAYNDFFDNLAPERYGYPKPFFQPEGNGTLTLAGVPVPRRADWGGVRRERGLGRRWPTRVVGESALLSLGVDGMEALGGRAFLEHWGLVPARDPGTDSEHVLYETPPGPGARAGWARMEALLRMLRDEVEADGARLRIAVVPALDAVYPEVWEEFVTRPLTGGRDEPRPRGGESLSPETPSQRVLAMAGDLGVPALDLLPPLREAGRADPDLYFPMNRHWTAAGHAVVARALEPWVMGSASSGEP